MLEIFYYAWQYILVGTVFGAIGAVIHLLIFPSKKRKDKWLWITRIVQASIFGHLAGIAACEFFTKSPLSLVLTGLASLSIGIWGLFLIKRFEWKTEE